MMMGKSLKICMGRLPFILRTDLESLTQEMLQQKKDAEGKSCGTRTEHGRDEQERMSAAKQG